MSGKSTGKQHIVKSISIKKRSVTVSFEDEAKYELSHASYSDLRLYEGKKVSGSEFALLVKYAEEDSYYSYALSLISLAPQTSFLLRGKIMNKGASKEVASSVVRRLVKEGLLNDRDYAISYIEDIGFPRLYGKRKILAHLKEKGISAEILSSIHFDEEAEWERAIALAESLNGRLDNYPSAKRKEKAYATLLAKGFESDVARAAVEKTILGASSQDEEELLEKDIATAKRKYKQVTPAYERKRKIIASLLRKGYRYEQVANALEDMDYEDQ